MKRKILQAIRPVVPILGVSIFITSRAIKLLEASRDQLKVLKSKAEKILKVIEGEK